MTDTLDPAAGDRWHFPIGAWVAAILAAAGGGAALLLGMLITGMGHGARTPSFIWMIGTALLLGAAWLFWDAASDIRRAPSAKRTLGLRIYEVLSYLLCAASGAVGAWSLAMMVLL